MPSITIIITINDFGTIDCFSVFMTNAPLLWKSVQTNRARFHRTLDFIGFFAFHTATNIVGGCIFGSRQPSLRKDRACPRYRVAPLARQSLTRFEGMKNLSSCLPEVVRITLPETRREAKRSCVSSALCRQVLKLLTFQGRLLCSIANCLSSLRRPADFSRLIDLTVYGIVPFISSFTI